TSWRAVRLIPSTGAIDEPLGLLEAARFVAPTAEGGWVLARSTAHTTLYDLYEALDLPLAGKWREGEAEAEWQHRVAPVMQLVTAAGRGGRRTPLAGVAG